VGPQQLSLQILRLCIHAPPPWTWQLIPRPPGRFKVEKADPAGFLATGPARPRPAWCSTPGADPHRQSQNARTGAGLGRLTGALRASRVARRAPAPDSARMLAAPSRLRGAGTRAA